MAFLTAEQLELVQKTSPGLQLVAYWTDVAEKLGEDARSLLSFLVSGLISRGWLKPFDGSMEAAVEGLDFEPARAQAAAEELIAVGLMQVADGRITTLAGIFSTTPTQTTYFMGEDQSIHLLGGLGALSVSKALGRPGEVLADCGFSDPKIRLKLVCDASGVHSRSPDTVCTFLPHWDGECHPADALAGGGLFADDDALYNWQERVGEPEGMPLPSMMFPMAATELGAQLGKALESCLDRFANFH